MKPCRAASAKGGKGKSGPKAKTPPKEPKDTQSKGSGGGKGKGQEPDRPKSLGSGRAPWRKNAPTSSSTGKPSGLEISPQDAQKAKQDPIAKAALMVQVLTLVDETD